MALEERPPPQLVIADELLAPQCPVLDKDNNKKDSQEHTQDNERITDVPLDTIVYPLCHEFVFAPYPDCAG